MKIVVACYGTRGDVEPCAAVGCELLNRGHDVLMAVPPDLVGFIESAGLAASAYGPDLQAMLDARKFHTFFFRNFWSLRELASCRAKPGSPGCSAGGDGEDADMPTEADEEVASWIAAGTAPIFFGFGSMRVESSADTLAMISAACTELGERALVCAAGTDFTHIPQSAHVKVVGTVNFAATFPACRAVVHHGGAGTTAASLRAGVPTLILQTDLDQTLWGVRVKRLKVGAARRFSTTTQDSLVEDLRRILAPEYATRSREFATRMTKSAASVAAVADLMENFVLRRAG